MGVIQALTSAVVRKRIAARTFDGAEITQVPRQRRLRRLNIFCEQQILQLFLAVNLVVGQDLTNALMPLLSGDRHRVQSLRCTTVMVLSTSSTAMVWSDPSGQMTRSESTLVESPSPNVIGNSTCER